MPHLRLFHWMNVKEQQLRSAGEVKPEERFTQAYLAEKLGVDKVVVTRLKKVSYKPSPSLERKLSDYFGCSVEELYGPVQGVPPEAVRQGLPHFNAWKGAIEGFSATLVKHVGEGLKEDPSPPPGLVVCRNPDAEGDHEIIFQECLPLLQQNRLQYVAYWGGIDAPVDLKFDATQSLEHFRELKKTAGVSIPSAEVLAKNRQAGACFAAMTGFFQSLLDGLGQGRFLRLTHDVERGSVFVFRLPDGFLFATTWYQEHVLTVETALKKLVISAYNRAGGSSKGSQLYLEFAEPERVLCEMQEILMPQKQNTKVPSQTTP